jgi:hypothetical protein
MGKTRKMRLVAFLKTGPTCHHHGMWRHPETDNDFLDPTSSTTTVATSTPFCAAVARWGCSIRCRCWR